jgi:hypothetical protein
MTLSVQGEWIKDEFGRSIILRGANLGGSSKVPARPDGASRFKDGFYDYRDVSFVGRPFPLAEADEHLGNLASWGMRFLRLVVTWEAIEHAGPGLYDEAYLDYLRAVVEAAARRGITIYIDPHQDAWSRWTGGDGAPAWTLEMAGFDLRRLHASGAALLHQESPSYPCMIWGSNYNRLACATMFSLFYGGNEFAPGIEIGGEPVQDFLQGHFIESMRRVALALRDLPNVAGFGALNEPSLGFLGLSNLNKLQRWMIRKGPMPSPYQAMLSGAGRPQRVTNWQVGLSGNYPIGAAALNPDGVRAWRDGVECLWKRVGVWDDAGGKPVLKRPEHFHRAGNPADAFMKPFMLSFLKAVRAVEAKSVFFVEGVPNAEHPTWKAGDIPNAVNASHWYDSATWLTKRYQEFFNVDVRAMRLYVGPRGVRRCFRDAIGSWKRSGLEEMGGLPTLLGEFGMPFDLKGGAAYRSGDFSVHEKALTAYYDALDSHLLSATIWNYCADNTNELGDKWNDEDFSIYSRDSGGPRALKGFCRPYAWKTAGTPLSMRFDGRRALFEYLYQADPGPEAPTEIFVPACHYPAGYRAEASFVENASPGKANSDIITLERDPAASTLLVRPPKGASGKIRVILRPLRSDKR